MKLAVLCIWLTFAALMAAQGVKAVSAIAHPLNKRAVQVQCVADTECLARCPASDAACDGGPQS